MEEILAEIDSALDRARAANSPDQTTRSRQLSLAITKLEEARFWVLDSLEHLTA